MNKGLYSYALFALPLSFIGIPLYIYLPEYYSSNFGISLASIGLIILLTRMFDTITDPICGYISDSLATFRKMIICLSALMLGVSFYALFNPVCGNKMVNLIVFSVITYLFFSLLTINHIALIGNFKDRVLTSSVRESFTVIGLLLATITPSLLMLKYSSIQTFKMVGVGVFFFLLLCMLLFSRNVNVGALKTKLPFKLRHVNNPILWKYFTVLLFNGMAIATPSTLILFYIKNFLQLEKYTGLFLATYFVSAILFIPLWQFICNKIGAMKLFKISMVCSIGVFSLCYFVTSEDFLFYLVICLLSGIFFGIDLIAPTLITNNIIETQNMESVRAFIFSITHFISKIAIAVVSGSLLIVLGSKFGNEYTKVLHFSYTILPCIFKIMALYMLHHLRTV
jgi:GPH family glycoside/pentoside/hexuronide:cation symporter